MNEIKRLASPLTVVGFLLFLCGLIYLIFDYESVSLATGQGWGLLALGVFWIPAIVFMIAGLIVKSIFKKRKTQLIVDAFLLLTLVVVIFFFYVP